MIQVCGKTALSIKAFTADGQGYVYSAWSNEIARVSNNLYSLLRDDAPLASRRETAQRLGLLPSVPIPIEVFPDEMIATSLAEVQRSGPSHLVLTVTEACNFRCRYCSYSGAYYYGRRHGKTHMTEQTAFAAVNWYLRFERLKYSIGFYGGEPLLRRPLIERVIDEARAKLPTGSELSLSMTSNGWLLDPRSIQFLVDNGIDLFVSLDGPASIHDRYRLTVRGKPTFARVWNGIRKVRQRYPEYYDRHVNFSMTLAPPNAMAEVHAFIQGHAEYFSGKALKLGTLNGSPSRVLQELGLSEGNDRIDLSSLRRRYIDTLVNGNLPDDLSRACNEAAMAKIHNRNMTKITELRTSAGQCTPGKRCHITLDGRMHMCEHGDEQRPIGHVDGGFDPVRIREQIERFRDFVQPRCQQCWAVRLCSKCIPQLAMGTTLSPDVFSAQCASIQAALEHDLADYCRARSRNERCFDSLSYGRDEPIAPFQ